MQVFIEECWVNEEEGDIIIEYCQRNNIKITELSTNMIKKLTYDPNIVIIASYDILREILNDKTDTYNPIFNGLYGTEKIKTKLKNVIKFPTFIKPVETKVFNGRIFNHIIENEIDTETEVYISDIMDLENERRILIDSDCNFYGLIPEEFKKTIIERIGISNKCWVIDIAINKKTNKLIIVEINPTYSLGYIECEIVSEDEYVKFIFNAWQNR
jgi:hypothetical protein